ncbi:MAG: hypothetical protein Ct9H300mP4_11480 [Gammaproteobacteria bacterium]|nr:MAG: hypothetical protein Ct9H300mP4_11480 [Gammaproteobacteria bacterium]
MHLICSLHIPSWDTGWCPKVRAMQLIDAIEPDLRGIYGGTVGYFGKNGDMDQAIAIRTIVFSKGDIVSKPGVELC